MHESRNVNKLACSLAIINYGVIFLVIKYEICKVITLIQVLDTRDLRIDSVTNEEGEALKHSLGEEHKAFGKPLRIELPHGLKR